MEINKKSFNKYQFNEQELGQSNIFFGTNGSGKTALAEAFSEINEEKTKIFNTEYVRNNIFLTESIQGIDLVVDKDNINMHNLNNELDSEKKALNLLENEMENIKNKIEGEIEGIYLEELNRFSLTKRNIQLKKKNNPEDSINAWKKESKKNDFTSYNNIIKQYSKNSLNDIEQQLSKEKKDSLELIKEIKNINFLDELASIFNKKIDAYINDLNTDILNWLKEGIGLHKNKKQCLFCNSEIDIKKIKSLVDKKINNEYYIFEEKTEYCASVLRRCLRSESLTSDDIPQFEKLLNYIKQKQENPTKIIDVDLEKFKLYKQKLIKSLSTEVTKKDSEIKKINHLKIKKNTIVKGIISTKIQQSLTLNKLLSQYREQKKQYNPLQKSVAEKTLKIKNLSKNNIDYHIFEKLANRELKNAAINFKIEYNAKKNGYIILCGENRIAPSNLSEGERRILGLVYFYYSLFYDEKNLSQNIDQVIFDDPVTSLDSNNSYYIAKFINDFSDNFKKQIRILVFTHVSKTFDILMYGKGEPEIIRFKIQKINGNSEIKKVSFKDISYSKYYQSTFLELFDFANSKEPYNFEQFNFIQYANKSRYIFESHARSHYNIQYVTNDKSGKLRDCYNVDPKDINKLEQLIGVINDLSHGSSMMDAEPISFKELRKNVRFLLRIFYKKDRSHVAAMVEDSKFKLSKCQWIKC